MDTEAERALSNLHVLAALSHNDKLLTNDDHFDIYYPTTWRAIMRTLYGERRTHNVQRVRNTVRLGIDAARRSLDDAHALGNLREGCDPQLLLRRDGIVLQHLRMVDALTMARGGLRNLMRTYQEDAAHTSQIRLVIEEIDAFCTIIAKHTSQLRGTARDAVCDAVCGPPSRETSLDAAGEMLSLPRPPSAS